MKYCSSENQEVTFKEILKSDSKKLKNKTILWGKDVITLLENTNQR